MAIQHTYSYATHGAMSRVMSVVEKNAWLAKHYIETVIANSIPIYKDNGKYEFLDDYSLMNNYINVYQDYINKTHLDIQHNFFNYELLASPDFTDINKDKIEDWMKEDSIPQFDEWILDKNKNVVLYTLTNIRNDFSGVEEDVWISTGAIKKEKFDSFLTKIENDFEDRIEMLNVSGFHTCQDCRCYCTPQEACLVHSEREIYNKVIIPDTELNIEIFKLVEECICADELITERCFILPSKITRAITNIEYGDGFSYVNSNGKIIASYSSDEEDFASIQRILKIKGDVLKQGLDKENLKIFWLFRVSRSPSPKARERFKDIMFDDDKTYLVWEDNNHFCYKTIQLDSENDSDLEGDIDNFDL